MPRELSSQSSLEALRREAKRWLKALKAGDRQALERLTQAHAGERCAPTLRVVQHALAREYGFPTWAALKQQIEDRARSHADRVRLFLEKSAIRYSVAPATRQWNNYEPDRPARGAFAARLLARHPEIAGDSIHTAVAAGDLHAVRRFLAADPALADRPGGPDGWTPLLRLAHTRLPVEAASANAVEIARLLLDHGASPHAAWSDGTNDFTVLTGVIGGGEGSQPAHPRAEALARLLLSRGADPLNGQALYNTSLGPDDTFWLDLLWTESERRGETARWRSPCPSLSGPPLDYLLGNAVPRHPRRAEWLLGHGARADALNTYSKQPIIKAAVLHGRKNLADLLVRHGATLPDLSGPETFVRAAMESDAATLRTLAERHPEYLRDPAAMFAATLEGLADVAALLLDLGMSPDVGDATGFRALHYTTHSGAVDIARLLIARGAEIDPVERCHNSTPLGHADYHDRREMVALLAPLSRDIRGLCCSGSLDRLVELFTEDRSLASRPSRGEPPLFALPDDDERAAETAELLLSFGADPSARNAAGLTPDEAAMKRGLEEAAAIIGAERSGSGSRDHGR